MSTYRDIISGKRRGAWATVTREALGLLSVGYSGVTALRNRYYDVAGCSRLPRPCISVGNLTTGGTGKTPLVAWLAAQLARQQARVAILSRGYKGGSAGNDEHLLLQDACPRALCLADPDRVRAGRLAIEQHGCDVLILDDGFQHRRLARDLDIVLVDALCPDGYGHVLPRGLLRERFAGLNRADIIVLSRISQAGAAGVAELRARCQGLSSAVVLGCDHRPRDVVDLDGCRHDLAALCAGPVLAFAGIGNPEGFRATLSQLGAGPIHLMSFADHHPYDNADCLRICAIAGRMGAQVLVTTEKDMVKLRGLDFDWPAEPWAVRVDIDFAGEGGRILLERATGLLQEGRPAT